MTNTDATSRMIPVLSASAPRAPAHFALALTLAFTLATEGAAQADAAGVVSTPALATALAPSAPSPPYSLPWQLRPVTIGNIVRVDSTAAVFNDANGNVDIAAATVLAASYQLTGTWAPMMRLGFVGNNAPGAALDGSSFVNPIVGATYARRMGSYRLALFGATTIPVGTGGGNAPEVGAAQTNAASVTARPADDAMLAVNYLTEIGGVDFAYVNHGFTVQGEATLLQFVRVRGGNSAAATDSFRTNSAVGLHLGYFMGSHVSLGADLRYQRWLSHPTSLNTMTGAHVPISADRLDSLTVAAGPRLHFRLGAHAAIHPGISFVRGFDARGVHAPLITAQTTAVQLDIPVMF
jgi:hypothetical protein